MEVDGEQGPWTISLRYIASHPDYRLILEGLLQPGAGNPNGAQVRGSAEHTTLGDSAEHATLGDGAEHATLGDGAEHATLGDGAEHATLGDGAEHATWGDGAC